MFNDTGERIAPCTMPCTILQNLLKHHLLPVDHGGRKITSARRFPTSPCQIGSKGHSQLCWALLLDWVATASPTQMSLEVIQESNIPHKPSTQPPPPKKNRFTLEGFVMKFLFCPYTSFPLIITLLKIRFPICCPHGSELWLVKLILLLTLTVLVYGMLLQYPSYSPPKVYLNIVYGTIWFCHLLELVLKLV